MFVYATRHGLAFLIMQRSSHHMATTQPHCRLEQFKDTEREREEGRGKREERRENREERREKREENRFMHVCVFAHVQFR